MGDRPVPGPPLTGRSGGRRYPRPMADTATPQGIELFSEVFDPAPDWSPRDPAVLLVSGADSHCTRWTPELIGPLVDHGLRVVRYDHRDCGLSTKVSSDVGYTLDDLADDALAVLDEHGIDQAHVVGRSMGGMVAQVLALDHPGRVNTLTLVSSTPGLGDDRLPSAANWLVDRMAERLFAPPPTTPQQRAAWVVELDEMFAGTRYPVATGDRLRVAIDEVERYWYPESGHGPAVNSSSSRLDRLGEVAVPTLVVHGTADPVFPVEHALALADGIPGSELWLVEGLGHEFPDGLVPDLLPHLLAHLGRA